MANGIHFDYAKDADFKAYVVQQLGKLDSIKDIAETVPALQQAHDDLRKEFDNSETWRNIFSVSGPVLVFLTSLGRRFWGMKI